MKADPDTHRQQVLSVLCAEISRRPGWKHTLVQLLTLCHHLSLQRAERRRFPPHQQICDSSPGLFTCPGGLAMSVCRRASGFGQPICNEAGMMQGVREFSSKRKRQRHAFPCLGDCNTPSPENKAEGPSRHLQNSGDHVKPEENKALR